MMNALGSSTSMRGLALIVSVFLGEAVWASAGVAETLQNGALTINLRSQDGAYEIRAQGLSESVMMSLVAAEVDHRWLRSIDYPRRRTQLTSFEDALGHGQMLTTAFSGLPHAPDLIRILRLYDKLPYGDVIVRVRNGTGKTVTVQKLRNVEAVGEPRINLGGPERATRVMAESFSMDAVTISDLPHAPHGTIWGVNDDLIYNRASKESLLVAALTSTRFLTILNMSVGNTSSSSPKISAFTVDSAGTTEPVSQLDKLPKQQQVELSVPLATGAEMDSERVMFAVGPDYHAQLEAYGEAIRKLHHSRVSSVAPKGWWSWTAFYGGINEGEVLTNAEWLATHLKLIGYNFLHVDEGYSFARGEYNTANATQFPHGMAFVGHRICELGLVFGIWVAPFEVSERAWIYEHYKDWLVRDAHGNPIQVGKAGRVEPVFALDATNPGAQAYLRETYSTLTREWGVRYIKLDFMDSSTIEGYRYLPNTTALEAQRMGLEIIRKAVGEDVLLDKCGSPMLNPVGLVDEGRISIDTGHSFQASRDAGANIAARYYMNRNFYISDPDAFTVSRQWHPQQDWRRPRAPLTIEEAQVSIVLAAVAGGMYEIGDDLATLGADPDRLALVENRELLQMVQLGRSALPLDLMTFPTEDEMPSVFLLHEDRRQSMLAVFNWTEQPRSHTFSLADLGLQAAHPYTACDVLASGKEIPLTDDSLLVQDHLPHSVRLIKIVDTSINAEPPSVTAEVPSTAEAGHAVVLSANSDTSGAPALSYHWDFGDGTDADGSVVTHTYTRGASYEVKLTVKGLDGVDACRSFRIAVSGYPNINFDLKHNQRYTEPSHR